MNRTSHIYAKHLSYGRNIDFVWLGEYEEDKITLISTQPAQTLEQRCMDVETRFKR